LRRVLSPWHDVPLRAGGAVGGGDPSVLNFICEIPRGTRRKFEISTSLAHNPIVQDVTASGAARSYALDSLVNYGALPQTYEDPAHVDAWARAAGDGDPLDVCEVGAGGAAVGAAYAVRVVGALAMLDGGECDWKLLAVRADDPLAAAARDLCAPDCPDALRRAADAVREWFRTYKVPEGKGECGFAFGGQWQGRDVALDVVASCHAQWRKAVAAALEQPRGGKGAAGGGSGGSGGSGGGGESGDVPWLPAAGWVPPAPAAFAPAAGSAALSGIAVA
jgi:inorganic pyrophosphatase